MTLAVEALILSGMEQVRICAALLMRRLPQNSFTGRDDLISSGNVGLCEAALRFDASRGVKFCSFASFIITGRMLDYLRTLDLVTRNERLKLDCPNRILVVFDAKKDRRSGCNVGPQMEAALDVERLLKAIEPRLAQVIRLHLAGLSNTKIGYQMGISAGRVHQLMATSLIGMQKAARLYA